MNLFLFVRTMLSQLRSKWMKKWNYWKETNESQRIIKAKIMTLSRRVSVAVHGINNWIIGFVANVSSRVYNRREMERDVVTLVNWNEHAFKDAYVSQVQVFSLPTEWKSCLKSELFPCKTWCLWNSFSSIPHRWKFNIVIAILTFCRYKNIW